MDLLQDIIKIFLNLFQFVDINQPEIIQKAIEPITLGLILGGTQLVKGGFDFFSGRSKAKKNNESIDKLLANLPKYEQDRYKAQQYQTPDQISKIENLAKSRLSSRGQQLPGQSIYEDRISSSQGQAIHSIQQTASNPLSALGAITDVYGRTQQSLQDLALRSSEYRASQEQQRIDDYNQALQTGAQYGNIAQQFNAQQQQLEYSSNVSAQQSEYQHNILTPAQINLSRYGANLSAGMAQQRSGTDALFSAPSQFMGGYTAAGGSFGNFGGNSSAPASTSNTNQPPLPGMGGSYGYKGV